MWLWAQWSAMENRAAELRYRITDPTKIEEPANRQVSTHGSIQTKPSLCRTHNYMDAGILASARNEPPWVIIISRLFRFTSNSETKSWKPKDRKWTPKKLNTENQKRKIRITEEFESNIKLTGLILHWQLQQIFSHQDLCGELEQQQNYIQTTPKSKIKILFTIALHFYRDITNETPMELNPVYFIFL